jgi:hypothetical protein
LFDVDDVGKGVGAELCEEEWNELVGLAGITVEGLDVEVEDEKWIVAVRDVQHVS